VVNLNHDAEESEAERKGLTPKIEGEGLQPTLIYGDLKEGLTPVPLLQCRKPVRADPPRMGPESLVDTLMGWLWLERHGKVSLRFLRQVQACVICG
jgi:hypothetical protein